MCRADLAQCSTPSWTCSVVHTSDLQDGCKDQTLSLSLNLWAGSEAAVCQYQSTLPEQAQAVKSSTWSHSVSPCAHSDSFYLLVSSCSSIFCTKFSFSLHCVHWLTVYICSTALFAAPQPFYTFYLLHVPLTAEINSFIFAIEEVPLSLTYLVFCKSQVCVCVWVAPVLFCYKPICLFSSHQHAVRCFLSDSSKNVISTVSEMLSHFGTKALGLFLLQTFYFLFLCFQFLVLSSCNTFYCPLT